MKKNNSRPCKNLYIYIHTHMCVGVCVKIGSYNTHIIKWNIKRILLHLYRISIQPIWTRRERLERERGPLLSIKWKKIKNRKKKNPKTERHSSADLILISLFWIAFRDLNFFNPPKGTNFISFFNLCFCFQRNLFWFLISRNKSLDFDSYFSSFFITHCNNLLKYVNNLVSCFVSDIACLSF